MGVPHEHHPGTGAGDGEQRADLQLTASMTQQLAPGRLLFYVVFISA